MDDTEFGRFVSEASSPLLRLAWLLTGDPHRAQDLAQSTFVKVCLAQSRIDVETALPYARRVMVNLHTDWLRRRPWREHSMLSVPDEPASGNPLGQVDDRQTLLAAMESLTRRERATLVLRYYTDLTESDTAQQLGVSVGTVKSVTSRALTKLRNQHFTADLDLVTHKTAEDTR